MRTYLTKSCEAEQPVIKLMLILLLNAQVHYAHYLRMCLPLKLLSAMIGKMSDKDGPLPQDEMEGVAEEEWVSSKGCAAGCTLCQPSDAGQLFPQQGRFRLQVQMDM